MAQVRQGVPLPPAQKRPAWRTGPEVTRGGKLIDPQIEGGYIVGSDIDDATITDATITDATVTDPTITGAAISTSDITEEAWTAASLQNSWVDYGAPHQTARYRQDSNGVVHIQGMIKDGTTTGGTLLFTLPAGYRPGAELWFVNYAAGGTLALISVAASGAVTIGAGFSATNTAINCTFAI